MSSTAASIQINQEVCRQHYFCSVLFLIKPHQVAMPETTAAVETMIQENQCTTIDEIAACIDISHGSAHQFHDLLQFNKVSVRWVPYRLTAELKEHCSTLKLKVMTSYKEFLLEMKPGFTTTNWKPKDGVITEHYISRGKVTSVTYTDLLKNQLLLAIMSKQCGFLNTGILLQHDNAQPHSAHATVASINDLKFKCLPHLPYSPDVPCHQ